MADQTHLDILKRGAQDWGAWRTTNPDIRPNLQDCLVEDIDLSGFDLSRSNLRFAIFRNARFGDCNLTGADMGGAILSGADLTGVTGLLEPHQFAGADLTGTRFPDSLREELGNLDTAKAISANAQNLFIAMLAACLYSWLTIATTSDINLIVNRATSPLPIIGTSIPIVGFYFVAPLLLVGIYFYFHFYLQKLWDEMGSLPAIFPDGRPLQAKADPWLLSDLVRSNVIRLRRDRPFLSHLQKWISIALAWWAVPFTLTLFWGRYLRRHDLIGTALHCVLTAICITSAIFLYLLASATLRGRPRRPFKFKAALKHLPAWRPAAIVALSCATMLAVSLSAIEGVRLGVAGRDWWPTTAEVSQVSNLSPRRWIPGVMERFGYPPFANLRGADLTARAGNSAGKSDTEKSTDETERANATASSSAHGLQLEGVDLRFADMRGSYLQGTILTDARLEWADLLKAKLTGAGLSGARMEHSDLLGADLASADLSGAALVGANLNQANLSGAELKYADLRGASGLTRETLTSARNWCNAFYDSDLERLLGLPPDNKDRIQGWRRHQDSIVRDFPEAAEAARVEQLSRLFPGTSSESLLGRLNDATMATVTSDMDEESERVLSPIPWPSESAPVAAPINLTSDTDSALPTADYLVITWTVEEARALSSVFTSKSSLDSWHRYAHNFNSQFKSRIRAGAPASELHFLGRYYPVQVGSKKVLLFKSELHFTQDGPNLPLRTLLDQVIRESGAKMVITTGTAGSIGRGLQVGDVVIASRAVFQLKGLFKDADFNNKTVSNVVTLPAAELEFANRHLFEANDSKLNIVRRGKPLKPQIYWDNTPQPNVVVTTDYFASDDTNDRFKLQCIGSVIESGDAVLGLVTEEMKDAAPKWLSIRNISVPQLSSDERVSNQQLSAEEGARLAKFYRRYGFWTSVQSAIATWAVISGSN